MGFAMPCHVETRRFTWVTGQVSPQAETEPLLLQRFVLPSKLHVLGILDDLHLALATKDPGTPWDTSDIGDGPCQDGLGSWMERLVRIS